MKKIGIITLVVLAFAAVASAAPKVTTKTATPNNHHHQCVPEPISMLALIPGIGMFIRRRNKKA